MACSGAADTSISECNKLLTDTVEYNAANDITEQRNALIEFYNSTGGSTWSFYAAGTALRDQIGFFVQYLDNIGTLAAQASFSPAALPAQTQNLYYTVAQLSVGCNVQASFLYNIIPQCCCHDCDQYTVSQHELQLTKIDHAVSTAHSPGGEAAGQVPMGQW